jgi:hypothetical protein
LIVTMVRRQKKLSRRQHLPERTVTGLTRQGFKTLTRPVLDRNPTTRVLDTQSFGDGTAVPLPFPRIFVQAMINMECSHGASSFQTRHGGQEDRRVHPTAEGDGAASGVHRQAGEALTQEFEKRFHRS